VCGSVWGQFRLGRGQLELSSVWVAILVSAFGVSVRRLALPLTVALELGTGLVERNFLIAVGTLPSFLCGLLVGVVVD
jgi:hypothetical protein